MQAWKKVIQQIDPAWKAAGLTLLWVAFLHPDILFQPNAVLLASNGDTVKNIYTLAWQLAHGTPFSTEFSGMGWPFTEHVFYTDGHPLFAWLIGGWLIPGVFPAEWTAGILHLIIILSWAITAAIIVKIFDHFGFRGWVAIILSGFIVLQHPQILRWSGHYALAYTLAIPLTWYLQLKWQKTYAWKWAIAQGLNLIVWLLTHAYLGAIAAAFAGLFGGMMWIMNSRNIRVFGQLLIATIGPLALYLTTLKLTDYHPFRTDMPYGFWDNVSQWNAALLPSHGLLGNLRRELGWGMTTWEGWGYLGTGTWVVGIVSASLVIFRVVQNRPFIFRPNASLSTSMMAGIILFAVAVGEPFLTGNREWLEQSKFFMQFRAIGRFTWPAVWVFPVAAICWLNQRKFKWGMMAMTMLVGLDAFWMQQEARHELEIRQNGFATAEPQFQRLKSIADENDAVAIHPLPYFQMGSESVGRSGTQRAHDRTLLASFHSGLPTTGTHLTRMSIPESRTLAEWMGHPALPKQLMIALSEEQLHQSILLFACDDSNRWLDDDYRIWNSGSPTADPDIRILKLENFSELSQDSSAVTLFGNEKDWRWKGLNQHPFHDALEGDSIAIGHWNEYLIVDTVQPDSSWLYVPWEASCWFWHGGTFRGRDDLRYAWVAEAEWRDGSREWIKSIPVAASGDHRGNWTRAALVLRLDSLPSSLYFFAVGFESIGDSIRADAYRIQPLAEIQ